MHRVKTDSLPILFVAGQLLIGLPLLAACSTPVTEQPSGLTTVTAFEGARLIVGDGAPPLENATFIVDDTRLVSVGRRGDVEVPTDATRVDLTGRTVMPAIMERVGMMGINGEGVGVSVGPGPGTSGGGRRRPGCCPRGPCTPQGRD